MVHSERMYKNICNFPKPIWYLVYYHEQINETIFSQDKWRPEIEKQIYFPHL